MNIALQVPVRVALPREVRLLLFAILATGFSAALVAMPVLWIVTPVLALLVVSASRSAAARVIAVEGPTLPPTVRQVLERTLKRLPDGDAERLLLEIARQATPMFGRQDSTFDDAHEAATRDNTSQLVVSCCDVALQLAQVDDLRSADILASQDAVQRAETRAKYDSTRAMLARQLTDAASALAALYVSGVEHGTPASERVAELVTEIRSDAATRSAAAAEMGALLEP